MASVVCGAERLVESRNGGLLAVRGRYRWQGRAVVIGQLLCGKQKKKKRFVFAVHRLLRPTFVYQTTKHSTTRMARTKRSRFITYGPKIYKGNISAAP